MVLSSGGVLSLMTGQAGAVSLQPAVPVTSGTYTILGTNPQPLSPTGGLDNPVLFDASTGTVVYLPNLGGVFGAPVTIGSAPNATALTSYMRITSLTTRTIRVFATVDDPAGQPGSVLVFSTTDGLTWNLDQTLPVGQNPSSVLALDENFLDPTTNQVVTDTFLAVTNRGDNTVSIFHANAAGVYSLSQTLAVGTAPTGLTAAPLGQDGLPSLITANSGSNNVSTLFYNPTDRTVNGTLFPAKTFLPARNFPMGNGPTSVVATQADFGFGVTLDGVPQNDLITANPADGSVTVRLRQPNGTVRPSQSFPAGNQPTALALLNWNSPAAVGVGAAHIALAVTNPLDGTVSILDPNTDQNGVTIRGTDATGNILEGNRIGTTADGNSALPNFADGVLVDHASSTRIGGTASGAGNQISGNIGNGIHLVGWTTGDTTPGVSNTTIQNNLIGTNAAGDSTSGAVTNPALGTTALGNVANGINVLAAANTTIDGNLVSGNQDGIAVAAAEFSNTALNRVDFVPSPGTVIQNNKVGTDITGATDLGQRDEGVLLDNVDGAIVDSNLLSGNGTHGFHLNGTLDRDINDNIIGSLAGQHNVIRNNKVGTDLTGLAPVGNGEEGIYVTNAWNNQFLDNLSAGNGDDGLALRADSDFNLVQGNKLGTDITGNSNDNGLLGNGQNTNILFLKAGLYIGDSGHNTIGGTQPGQGNVISGNIGRGILIARPDSTANTVIGNLIGVGLDGVTPVPNTLEGIAIQDNASNNIIGGTQAGAGNVIAYNGGTTTDPATGLPYDGQFGIRIWLGNHFTNPTGPTGNQILGNVIHDNKGAGIGVQDAGTVGNTIAQNSIYQNTTTGILSTNTLNPVPVIDSIQIGNGTTTIHLHIVGASPGNYLLEFFTNPTGGTGDVFRQGRTFITSATWNGDPNTPVVLTDAQTGGPLAGKNLTVTATLQGTTSEFSSSVLVTEGSNVVINPSMDPNTFGTLPYVLDNLIIPSTGLPEVTFNINTNEFPDPTIRPTISQPIPQLTVPITIDGTNVFTNQPVMIQGPGTTVPTPDPCNGPNATAPGIDGFVITFQASGSTLRHLELNGFRDAILIEGASNNTSFNNYLGYILADGTTPGNLRAGIHVCGGANNTLEYDQVGGNVLAGLFLDGPGTTGNTVHAGVFLSNGTGILVQNTGGANLIGDLNPTGAIHWNLIVNNTNAGIEVSGPNSGLAILGNQIMTNANGITLSNTSNVQIGGSQTGSGNTIDGNTKAGIFLDGAASNTITGNTIQGNGQFGIYLNGSQTTGNQIAGNTIDGARTDSSTLPPYNVDAYADDTTRQNQGIILNGANGNLIGPGNTITHNILGIEVVNVAAAAGGAVTNYNRVYANTISTNLIGVRTLSAGNTAVVGNAITQNAGIAVDLKGTSANNIIQGNQLDQNVGLNPALNINSPPNQVLFGVYNVGTGVYIEGSNNLVGTKPAFGPLAATPDFLADLRATPGVNTVPASAGNSFLGDAVAGVYIFTGAGNPIQGNTLGSAPDPYRQGQTARGNYGILLFNAPGNLGNVPLVGVNANRFLTNDFFIAPFQSVAGTSGGSLFSVSSSVNQNVPIPARALAAARAASRARTVPVRAAHPRGVVTTPSVPRGAHRLVRRGARG